MKNKNKILSNRIVILLIFLFHFLFIPAQNIRELEKVNKVYIKELKSKGYKSVEIKTGDNGFWYFLVGKKVEGEKVYGVINKDRKELFECKYTQIIYLPEIPNDGYRYHTFPSMQGGEETVSIYHYTMPGHFALENRTGHTTIALVDGSIIKDSITDDCFLSGSWIITNSKKRYIRNLGGYQRLMLVNNDTKNMGLMTWDGKEIVKNENFLIEITSKTKDTFNATFVFNTKNNAGGFYCEDLSIIVPTEYEEIEANYKKRTFNVKLSPIDKLHEYDPDIKEVYIPKNQGEQYLKEHKYKECIEYYSKAGVDDSDSKFFSSHAMFGIAIGHIMKLQNYLSVPSVNSKKGYDYQEAKSLLQNAIEILNTATIQDTVRQDIYKENISTYKKYLNILETNNSILKENSFGNMLAKSIMKGLADGITKSALRSINHLVSPSKTPNNISNSNTSVGTSDNRANLSSPSKESNSSSSQPAPQYRQCYKCRGTGEIFTTSTVATYGNDKKVVCPKCGKEHWLSTVHHHRKCDNCNGSGKVAK